MGLQKLNMVPLTFPRLFPIFPDFSLTTLQFPDLSSLSTFLQCNTMLVRYVP